MKTFLTVILGVIAMFAVFIASVWVKAIFEKLFHYDVDARIYFGGVAVLCACIVARAVR
jgi:hypothetical protein